MRTTTINIYQFSELSPKAQRKALDAQLEFERATADSWTQAHEDAEQVLYNLNSEEFMDGAMRTAHLIIENHGKECDTYKAAQTFIDAFGALPGDDDGEFRTDDFDVIESEFNSALSVAYSKMLQDEEDYRTSDEYLTEAIETMEYEFYENGELFVK